MKGRATKFSRAQTQKWHIFSVKVTFCGRRGRGSPSTMIKVLQLQLVTERWVIHLQHALFQPFINLPVRGVLFVVRLQGPSIQPSLTVEAEVLAGSRAHARGVRAGKFTPRAFNCIIIKSCRQPWKPLGLRSCAVCIRHDVL